MVGGDLTCIIAFLAAFYGNLEFGICFSISLLSDSTREIDGEKWAGDGGMTRVVLVYLMRGVYTPVFGEGVCKASWYVLAFS